MSSLPIQGKPLIEGRATGPVFRLTAPISLWGGVDPLTGTIVDPRHPDHGACVAGRVLAIPVTVGSSSSSAIMLEMLRNHVAPAALLLGTPDAIVTMGVVVARELGYETIPVVLVDGGQLETLENGSEVRVSGTGTIT